MRRALTVVASLIVVAMVVAAGAVAVPRIQHRRALARAIEARDVEALESLAEDADAVLALMEVCERDERVGGRELVHHTVASRHAVELFATTPAPRDSRVEDRLRIWTVSAAGRRRFFAFYLLEELGRPRFSDRAAALDEMSVRTRASDDPTHDLLSAADLARAAGRTLDGRLVAEFFVLRADGVDPIKALRAWAAYSDCELVERGDVLEVVPREHRS